MPITPAQVARIVALVAEGTLNDKLARQVLDGVVAGEGDPDEVVAARGLAVVSDDGALGAAIDAAIAADPEVAQKVRDGKVAAAGALVGAVMKADPRPSRCGPGTRTRPGAARRERLIGGALAHGHRARRVVEPCRITLRCLRDRQPDSRSSCAQCAPRLAPAAFGQS